MTSSPGSSMALKMTLSAPPAPQPQPLPRAKVVHLGRPWMRQDELVTWLVVLPFLVAMFWYALSLPVPHR